MTKSTSQFARDVQELSRVRRNDRDGTSGRVGAWSIEEAVRILAPSGLNAADVMVSS